MTVFSITFTDDPLEYPYDDVTVPAQSGTLILGNQIEGFLSGLGHWKRSDYESHWRCELMALVAGRKRVALVVDVADRLKSSNVELWALFRDGEVVYVQNHLRFYDDLPAEWTGERASDFLTEREVQNDQGQLFSEWTVGLRDIQIFLYRFGVVLRTVGSDPME